MNKLALVLGALALCACEPTALLDNSQFDAWCGETPCGWEVDGEVRRVGTWHRDDYAVELVSDDASIHQLIAIEDRFIGCLTFSMLTQVSEDAKLFIELDFLDDGVIDWDVSIPQSDYRSVSFSVHPPDWFDGVRVIVRKEGPGAARIARMQAETFLDVCGKEQVVLTNLPAGAPCNDDDACADGQCTAGTCAGCARDADCEDRKVCGYDELWNGSLGLQCVERGAREIGRVCHGDSECESGVCCDNVCSACCGDAEAECGDVDAICARPALELDDHYLVPHLCNPGLYDGEPGAFCAQSNDCISGSCEPLECDGECAFTVSDGQYCARFDQSCEDPEQDSGCCWFCGPEQCRISELPQRTCQ